MGPYGPCFQSHWCRVLSSSIWHQFHKTSREMLNHVIFRAIHNSLIFGGIGVFWIKLTTLYHKCSVGLISDKQSNTIYWKVLKCSSNQYLVALILHYLSGITYYCWSRWSPWMSGNSYKAVHIRQDFIKWRVARVLLHRQEIQSR